MRKINNMLINTNLKSEDFFINEELAKRYHLNFRRIEELIQRQQEILEWQDQMTCYMCGTELVEIKEGICIWKDEDDDWAYISSITFNEADKDNSNILIGVIEFGEECGYMTYKQNVVYNYKNNDLIIAE